LCPPSPSLFNLMELTACQGQGISGRFSLLYRALLYYCIVALLHHSLVCFLLDLFSQVLLRLIFARPVKITSISSRSLKQYLRCLLTQHLYLLSMASMHIWHPWFSCRISAIADSRLSQPVGLPCSELWLPISSVWLPFGWDLPRRFDFTMSLVADWYRG
jgi:hypothetical protein